MGDRTNCTLTFWKNTNIPEYEQLVTLIKDEFGTCDLITVNQCGDNEVNYGMLPDSLDSFLTSNNFSYLWEWGNGGEYNAGFIAYDAVNKKHGEYTESIGGGMLLSLPEARNPETLNQAIWWDEWTRRSKQFSVIDSPNDEFLENFWK